MDRRTKPHVSIWTSRAVIAVALCLVAFDAGIAEAQGVVIKARQAIVVPRLIRGQAVEAVVVNRVVLIFGEVAGHEEPTDVGNSDVDVPVAEHPKMIQRVSLFSGTYEELVYGSGSSAVDVRVRLEECLRLKLEKIDRISELTDAQRQKLRLAGRGDMKRLLDRVDKLRAMCDLRSEIADLKQFQKWTEDLKSETQALRPLLNAGPFDTGSLLAKCMKTVLTAEQAAKYDRYGATPAYQAPQRGLLDLGGALEVR